MVELTKKLIKWENWFLSLSFFGYVFIKTTSKNSKKLNYKVKRILVPGDLLAGSKPQWHCFLMKHRRANFGEPTGASTPPRHQYVGDSCITIIDLCVVFVCSHACAHGGQRWTDWDWDLGGVLTYWWIVTPKHSQLKGLLRGCSWFEKQAEGCL